MEIVARVSEVGCSKHIVTLLVTGVHMPTRRSAEGDGTDSGR